MPIEKMKFYNPEICSKHKNAIFVFGDNMIGKGTGGQACIRYCENSFGIPTKHLPARHEKAYFSDNDYNNVIPVLKEKFIQLNEELKSGKTIIWPEDGIGTGLADLPNRAPKIYAYIQKCFERLEELYPTRTLKTPGLF